jgi:hypothetical protein
MVFIISMVDNNANLYGELIVTFCLCLQWYFILLPGLYYQFLLSEKHVGRLI